MLEPKHDPHQAVLEDGRCGVDVERRRAGARVRRSWLLALPAFLSAMIIETVRFEGERQAPPDP